MQYSEVCKLRSRYGDIRFVETEYPREMADAVAQVLLPPVIHASDKQPFQGRFAYLPLYSLSLLHMEMGEDTVIEFKTTDSLYMVERIFSGSLGIEHAGYKGTVKAGEASLFLPGETTRIHVKQPMRATLVVIDKSILENQLVQLIDRPIGNEIVFDIPMDLGKGSIASWWRLIEYLENEFKHANSLYVDGSGVHHLEKTLVTSLLSCQRHNYSDSLSGCGPQVAPAHVRRAEVFVQTNARVDIKLDDIVEASGVARRTLFDGFKRFRGVTPMRLLRTVRLDGAYQELRNSDGHKSITDVALGWGFKHTGRFSIFYKQRFGETPSETLKCDP